MSKFNRIKHITRFAIILMLVFYFGIIAILNMPFIQNRITRLTAKELGNLLQTEVSIGNIDLGLLNRIIIQDVNIKDRQNKDMLKISRLSAKFEISSLLHGKIRINSIQLFGLNAQLNRPAPGKESNFQFIIDTFASKDTVKKESDIDLRINTILVRRGQIHYNLLSSAKTPGKFNKDHLNFNNISMTLSLKALTADSINAQVRRMSFNEESGFRLKKLALRFTANKKGMKLTNMELQLPDTQLSIDTLQATYDSIPTSIRLDRNIRYATQLQARITPSDLSCFVPALKDFTKPIDIKVSIEGQGNRTECTEFYLSNSDRSMLVQGEGMANHWNKTDEMYLFGKITEMHANTDGLSWLLKNLTGNNDIPAILERVQYIRFKGDISGYLHQLTTHGTLESGVGDLYANVTMYADPATSRRSYSGKISSPELDLGTLLDKDNTFGNANFDLELEGFQYKNGMAESYVKGSIPSITYKQYEYKNIRLDGKYTPGGFNGKLTLNDENASIDINGSFATRQAVPDYNLTAIVRHLRPHALNISNKYENTTISLKLNANFQGHSIDDMEGAIDIDSLTLAAPDSTKSYFLKNLNITADIDPNGQKQVDIHSSFMNGSIKGNYSYKTLPASIFKTMQIYIPSLLDYDKKLPETKNNFDFQFQLDDSQLFSKVLDIPLDIEMPATLAGFFNDSQNKVHIRAYAPQFTYNGSYYEGGNLLCDNNGTEMQCQIRTNKKLTKGAMLTLAINAIAKDDKLQTTVNWGNNTESTFSGELKTVARFLKSESHGKIATNITVQPSEIILNDSIWKIHPSEIHIDKNIIDIQDFHFEHGNQFLRADGRIGKEENDSCMVDLNNIDLQYVLDIVNFHTVKFNGLATGRVHLLHILDKPVMYTRLDVKDFRLNDALLGQADIHARWDEEIGGVRLSADMHENGGYTTKVDGFVSPKMKGLDLHIQAGGTQLAFLQPFISGIFSDMKGRTYGNVRLHGPFAAMDLEGDVRADASMKINILNTSFRAQTDSVHITSGYFGFNNVRLTDPEGHTGYVNGNIRHTKLKNLMYQFQFDTRNMLVYHTEKETPDFPFYGQIYTTGNIRLRGGNNTLSVDGNVRTDRGTTFTYVTATAAEATSNQFITFVDKTPRRKQDLLHTELYHHLNRQEQEDEDDTPIDMYLNLQIETTPEATMRIIMDPVAGDNISAKGTGNLQMNFYNKGEFQMFGNYNINEGIYKMSIQNVIRKDFILQPGGIVSFNGNPKQANLNVQAVYTVNSASLNDLVADASNSKGTVKVNCLINMSGNLTAPSLSFGLELPTVSDEDRELVQSLTSTEEQMNTQFIYLLSIGKFYTYDYANNSTQSDATSSLAFSTLSGQLNNMLSQVINSQNWNIGTNLSTGEKGWTDVEAEAILSGRLLNNRLIINGNFGYRDNPMRNTNFVGDFEAMWLLTKNGDLRLKGYNQTNDRYFTKSTLTTQGIGLMYSKDFTSWRELFDWLLLNRRKNRPTEEQDDQPAAQQKREKDKNK